MALFYFDNFEQLTEDYEIYWSPYYDIANKRYSKLKKDYESETPFNRTKHDLNDVKKAIVAFCRGEEETRQILGYGIKGLKKDLIYSREDYFGLSNSKILKYFKY